jgi:hypothetical protein
MPEFFKTLFSFIENVNGLSVFQVADLAVNNNDPNIDLKTHIQNKCVCIKWSNGRTGLSVARFTEIVLYFIQ